MAAIGAELEPWAAVSEARRMLDRQPPSPRSPNLSGPLRQGSTPEPNLRSPHKKKRASRQNLPAVSSPEQAGTPGFAMLQAQTAVAQVRSLARLSIQKNREIVEFGTHVNTELHALRKRMENERQEDKMHETLEHRVARGGGVVDDMREELSGLAIKRRKKEQYLVDLTDEQRENRVMVLQGMSNSPADSPDAVRLGVVKAKYESIQADHEQMLDYRPTLVTLHRRAREACLGAQGDIKQLQTVISDADGEASSMRETLRLLQAMHVSTNNERNQYLKTLVMDKMAHAQQLKMRQDAITMERQIESDSKKREEARIKELNRPKEKEKRRNFAQAAGSGFENNILRKNKSETRAKEQVLEGGMRRLEIETGITTAEELISRWENHGVMAEEQESTAVGMKRRFLGAQAEAQRLRDELEFLVLGEKSVSAKAAAAAATTIHGRARLGKVQMAAASVAEQHANIMDFEQLSSLTEAGNLMLQERTVKAMNAEALMVRVRETLLGLLLRVCPRETRSTHWSAAQWDADPLDVVKEIGMVVYAMGTEVCGGEMPTQVYVNAQLREQSEWQDVIYSNMQSDDFQKYNTRVAPINLHHGNESGIALRAEKAAHAPAAVAAEDHIAHFGHGHFTAAEILAKARSLHMIGEELPDKDRYGMRTKKKKKKRRELGERSKSPKGETLAPLTPKELPMGADARGFSPPQSPGITGIDIEAQIAATEAAEAAAYYQEDWTGPDFEV